jgi:hypothetical protein
VWLMRRSIAIMHIMNDDVDTAEQLLSKGNSPFHQVRRIFEGGGSERTGAYLNVVGKRSGNFHPCHSGI